MKKTPIALRAEIRKNTLQREEDCVTHLLERSTLDHTTRNAIRQDAYELVALARKDSSGYGMLDAFMQEFGLSNKEGVALLCIAEALLRIPDSATADKLIAEKVADGNWRKHLGSSPSVFVNASTWGLMLTGSIITLDTQNEDKHWHDALANRLGEPIVRQAMLQAMRILGKQFVMGRSIDEALTQSAHEDNSVYSFDMLGEGARTQGQAQQYYEAYENAIHAIGKQNTSDDPRHNNGISIKLSALHPHYNYKKHQRMLVELYPRVLSLAQLAKHYRMGLSIDAEESHRLELNLDIFEALLQENTLSDWNGLGFVLQAYQKRAPLIADWLIRVATRNTQKINVRLVKGAYWDAEIKHAQEQGFKDYPVFTKKNHTDLSYQICAHILLQSQDHIFPQFATHNAYTIALIHALSKNKQHEMQRLHGMGQHLYQKREVKYPCATSVRIYAPVGAHKDLLPYLVRRLLENGANSSFVNRFLDEKTPIENLTQDVEENIRHSNTYRHPKIPLPQDIFQHSHLPRENAEGIDLRASLKIAKFQRCL